MHGVGQGSGSAGNEWTFINVSMIKIVEETSFSKWGTTFQDSLMAPGTLLHHTNRKETQLHYAKCFRILHIMGAPIEYLRR